MQKEVLTKFVFHIDPEHYPLHEYLTICNNICASILKYVDSKKLVNYPIPFQNEKDKATFSEFREEDPWQEWLLENGYAELMYRLYYSHTFYSLVADFCNYLIESINSAAKMKVAVSYALLRKPFKDTLSYIEWLYVDHQDLINKLIKEAPSMLKISPHEAELRIKKIQESTSLMGFYDFRFNRNDPRSLEHIWNNANHIITERIGLSRTMQGNLNFIFSNESSLREFSDYYYFVVPGLVTYATDLICDIFETLAELNNETIKANHVIRVLRHARTIDTESINEILEACRTNKTEIKCPKCGMNIPLVSGNIDLILDDDYVCQCGYTLRTGLYMFDWE